MDRISVLPDELLVKILSSLPHKEVVSTSILSKRWESLWLWIPKLKFAIYHKKPDLPMRDFITKNLSFLKPPVLESFHLHCYCPTFQPEEIKHWVETSVSRCVRELSINYHNLYLEQKYVVALPSSLYSCKSLVTLKLNGCNITVDVPRTVDLPCLKNLELANVTYSKKDSLQLLLSYCPVLEDLVIERDEDDNLKAIVVHVKSLLRLSLPIDGACSCDEYVIVTPSLKYFKVHDFDTDQDFSCLEMHMPNVKEADLIVDEDVETLFESITSIKRLLLTVLDIYGDELVYRNDIVFNQLENLELTIRHDYWYKILFRLLKDSHKLRVLKILNQIYQEDKYDESPSWNHDVPICLLETLETFEFVGYTGRQEERDVVSYILKNAHHLKSSSIKH